MTPPETRYARSGNVRIAYQVLGNGPFDLVYVPGYVSNMDLYWEGPAWSHFFSRLASFSRLILFDKRGTGLSDRMAGVATLEERKDDVRAVMDAAHSEKAALYGVSEGGPMALLFTATYPDRTRALVLYGSYACHPSTAVGREYRCAHRNDRPDVGYGPIYRAVGGIKPLRKPYTRVLATPTDLPRKAKTALGGRG